MSLGNEIEVGDQLYLLELFVNKVFLLKQRDAAHLQLEFVFIDFPPFQLSPIDPDNIISEEDGDVLVVPFQTGKSCFFGSETCELSSRLKEMPLRISLQQNAATIATTTVSLFDVLSKVIAHARSHPDEAPISKSLKDKYSLRDDTNQVLGSVALFIRLSWNGKQVITDFKRLGNDNTFVFRATGTDCVFKCKSKQGCSDCFIGSQEGDPPSTIGNRTETVSAVMGTPNSLLDETPSSMTPQGIQDKSFSNHEMPKKECRKRKTVTREDDEGEKTISDLQETIEMPKKECRKRKTVTQPTGEAPFEDDEGEKTPEETTSIQMKPSEQSKQYLTNEDDEIDQKLKNNSKQSEIRSPKPENVTVKNKKQNKSPDIASLNQRQPPDDIDITSTAIVPKGYHRDPKDPSIVWIGKDGYRVVRITQGEGYTNGDVMAAYIHIASENTGIDTNAHPYRMSQPCLDTSRVKRRRSAPTPSTFDGIPYCHIHVSCGHKNCIQIPIHVPQDQGWFKTPSLLKILRKTRSFAGVLRRSGSPEKTSKYARKPTTKKELPQRPHVQPKRYRPPPDYKPSTKEIKKANNKAVSQTTVSQSKQKVGVEAVKKIGIQAQGTCGPTKVKAVPKRPEPSPAKEVELDLESAGPAQKKQKLASQKEEKEPVKKSKPKVKKAKPKKKGGAKKDSMTSKGSEDSGSETVSQGTEKDSEIFSYSDPDGGQVDIGESEREYSGDYASMIDQETYPAECYEDSFQGDVFNEDQGEEVSACSDDVFSGADQGQGYYAPSESKAQAISLHLNVTGVVADGRASYSKQDYIASASGVGGVNMDECEPGGVEMDEAYDTHSRSQSSRVGSFSASRSNVGSSQGSYHQTGGIGMEREFDTSSSAIRPGGIGNEADYGIPSESRTGGIGTEGVYSTPSRGCSKSSTSRTGGIGSAGVYNSPSGGYSESAVQPLLSASKSQEVKQQSVTFDPATTNGKVYKFRTVPTEQDADAVTFNVIITKKRERKK